MPSVAFIPNVYIANSLRARILINLSAVLYKQAAAQTSLPAKVSNIDLNFVPSIAFIPNVHIADSLRARTLINLSAVLYNPHTRTLINLSAVLYKQVSIIDLNFVPSITFNAIENVELTGDLLDNADRVNNNNNNVAPTLQFSLTALLNLRLLASKRPALSGSDLNCRPSPAKRIKTNEDRKKSTHRQGFNSSSSLKLQKTSSNNDNVQLVGDNIEKLIYISKVKHTYKYLSNSSQQGRIKVSFHQARNNRNNLNIIVTNPTSREFGRTDIRRKQASEGPLSSPFLELISITLYKFYKGKNIQLLRPVFKLQRYDYYNLQDSNSLTQIQAIDPSFQTDYIYVLRSVDKIQADVANVFNTVVSKSDEVPTQEPSSHIKTELYPHQKQALYFMLRDNSRKFYHLVITSENTHYKQTIKKAYIMSLERASLILFMT
ncbi:hypothetical protein HBI78_204060 [Parastagonospora nodorum]|nr:hypothetical protein HBI78_204060 [Parastagonospora nodorum]